MALIVLVIVLGLVWVGMAAALGLALLKAASQPGPHPDHSGRSFAFPRGGAAGSSAGLRVSASARRGSQRVLWLVTAMAMPVGAGQNLVLEWTPSDDPTVRGYKIYFQNLNSTNVASLDAGAVTLFTLTNLPEASTYSIYATAYDAEGLESDPSNTLQFTVPLGPITTRVTLDPLARPVMTFDIEAVPDKPVSLQSSTNLVDWVTLFTSEPGQSLSCQVTNSSTDVRKFYRSICPL